MQVTFAYVKLRVSDRLSRRAAGMGRVAAAGSSRQSSACPPRFAPPRFAFLALKQIPTGDQQMAAPDFYLASSEGYNMEEPRRCWKVMRFPTAWRHDDLLLMKIDPPLWRCIRIEL